MRTITGQRRQIDWQDVLHGVVIFITHHGFYALYIVLILSLRLAIKQDEFFPESLWTKHYFYYPLVAPTISALLHITYAELGSPTFRFFMWLHMMINVVYIAVIALI